jgi:hypothetical protein
MQELELAKALKPSKKFGSGLSLSNKATVTKIKTGRGGHVLDLHRLWWCQSEFESVGFVQFGFLCL